VADIKEVDYKKLHLDLENPRLPTDLTRKKKDILTWIAKTTGIADLMSAIGTNGFFPGEPLVVYPHPDKNGEFIVIEGNRRLVAVTLLHNPNECDKPTTQIVEVAKAASHRPEKLPVVVQQTRKEVLPYLGFRHITGITEWEPLAKARYLKQLFDLTEKKKSPSDRYAEVAKAIGSRRDAIKRSLDALAVYKVIEKSSFFGIEDLSEETIKFSVLSTALADERIGEFVGTAKIAAKGAKGEEPERTSTDPIVNPDSLKSKQIGELSRWLFEKKDSGETILGESRNLRQLAHVVSTPQALAALRKGSTLSYAYRFTVGINEDFVGHLYNAQASLTEAASMVANVKADAEAQKVASDVFQSARLVARTMKDKAQAGSDDDDL
jgi:hypothetical protein